MLVALFEGGAGAATKAFLRDAGVLLEVFPAAALSELKVKGSLTLAAGEGSLARFRLTKASDLARLLGAGD